MKRLNKLNLTILLFLIAIFITTPINALRAFNITAPILTGIQQNTDNKTFLLTGVTDKNTEILIYIDGSFIGEAKIVNSDYENNTFNYLLPTNIEQGAHIIKALAKDKTSLVLSIFSNELEYFVSTLPAPTLIEPNTTTITSNVKPYIKGLIPSGTFARIYIDGVYNGKTDILEHSSGTANFAYKPFLNLKPGHHTAWAITEDENGKKSEISNILNFEIKNLYPAPILLNPVTIKNEISEKKYIVGLAKNDSKIKVYIDQKLYGEFLVKNDDSGTANFAYSLPINMHTGSHIIYTTATDYRGKESLWSNIIRLNNITALTPRITEEGVSEKNDQINTNNSNDITSSTKNTEEKKETTTPSKTEPQKTIPESTIKNENNGKDNHLKEDKDDNISDLIEKNINEEDKIEINEKEESTGMINEKQEEQSQLRLNLIIFIVFLISVIAWIFWVNRELIKEKKEEDQNKQNSNK